MPYYIESDNPGCSGWATVKDDGAVIGCHNTKQDATAQMVAVSLEEGLEPGGERAYKNPMEEEPRRGAGLSTAGQAPHVQGKGTETPPEALGELRALPDAYRPAVSDDVPEGRACGNCRYYDESMIDTDGVRVWCSLWDDWVRGDYYCDRWVSNDTEESQRQVTTTPPGYIRQAAARGLELRADGYGGDGLTDQTIREARAMARGDLSEDKIVRAAAWAARHAASLDSAANNDPDADGWPGPGAVAHYLWGIDPLDPEPARVWFTGKSEQIQEESGRMATAPTDDLRRRVEFRARPSDDGLTLEGYAAVFDEWTTIDSWEGRFEERISPGAFRRTIGQRMPVLQFDHGAHPLIGSIPLGRITSLQEDSRGLKIRARLSDNWLVEPVRDAIRDGAIDGMSFRFRVLDDEWTRTSDGMSRRTIREVELYEVGPVVFPAYEQTTVGVRSRQALDALSDPAVRSEIARVLTTGTDHRSLACDDDPAAGHSSPPMTPAGDSHVTASTKAQRRARAYLALEA